MPDDSNKHRRRSIRLRGYDYAQVGAYFVTVCTQNMEYLFGDVLRGAAALSEAGEMVRTVWEELSLHYSGIGTDAFVVMPNHIHGVVILSAPPVTGKPSFDLDREAQGIAPMRMGLPDVVHRFKTLTTKRYTDGVKDRGWQRFSGRLWQRNYWEHVIRDEDELGRIREYIVENPAKWECDPLHGPPNGMSSMMGKPGSGKVRPVEKWMV